MAYIKLHGKIKLVGEPKSKVETTNPDEEFNIEMIQELNKSAELIYYSINDYIQTFCKYRRILKKRGKSLWLLYKYSSSLFNEVLSNTKNQTGIAL